MSVPALAAASMVIIDDRPDLHVLIGLRRPGSTFVGGLIVYPGGGVDPQDFADGPKLIKNAEAPGLDRDQAAAHLLAALRETREEVGLELVDNSIDGRDFVHVGHWVTPEDSPRRYDTHFFLARYLSGDPVCDNEELVDVWWERPADALRRLDLGEIAAIAPTLSFLTSLSRYRNVQEAFAGTKVGKSHRFPWGVTTF